MSAMVNIARAVRYLLQAGVAALQNSCSAPCKVIDAGCSSHDPEWTY
jgi:hypothetical protein